VYVIYYNYRVIHISHLIVVVLFKLFAKTEKITMEDSIKANGMLKYSLYEGYLTAVPLTLETSATEAEVDNRGKAVPCSQHSPQVSSVYMKNVK
jgi:hypothetical protein